MTNFGVQTFLEEFLLLAPKPSSKSSNIGEIESEDENFSGFVFKIQANMNPNHRDRIAFIRICSGFFKRGMSVFHNRIGKEIKLAEPQQFMAKERTIIEEGFPGDIIGVFDPGIFNIGDTLSEKNNQLKFDGIPIFLAEYFARISSADTMKRKQFIKGINQLSEEGAIQVFKQIDIGIEALIIGTVGVLQFEVLEYRLKNEYGVDIKMQQLSHKQARWIENIDLDPRKLNITGSTLIVLDKNSRYVILCENEWSIKLIEERNKELKLNNICI